ncbi:Gfo/Idh/MocA family oxidoreductase [Paenibacillus sp. Soil750]|uniref:Gfo/Idh/MocA family oxidoreductase n=1 Tax=Paenibacillus sp. Soil750 TaxID=1736398 RepID=UPI0006F901AA|nr:hypothetical protein ASL11_12050 [Paenibacillus sp. Soil750]
MPFSTLNLDIVDICTPNLYHSEIAIAALEAGVHVICESIRNNHFHPNVQFLKKFAQEGGLKMIC